ncbi:MAG: tetratricopeptide repeat protein [Planctomycetes bacterium]|nr:tetratricopeptide repeat protein [Planctomycetota bacterium]
MTEARSTAPSDLVLAIALGVVTLLVYGQVFGHEFIAFDDGTYLKENPHIRDGLTLRGIAWAFETGGYASNWHPLTWISHMLDVSVFGLQPGWHHLSNVLYHVANTILLFVFLRRVGTAAWGAAFVAALFALHPTHVESVAWASERKDTLSTMFWLLTMLAYARYTRAPSTKGYVKVAVLLTLGLMAKPMLVTLPFVLLLLDYWPLRRAGKSPSQLFTEKLPLIAIAVVSMIITVIAQDKGGAVKSLERFGFGTRVMNSIVSYGEYLWKTVAPVDLAFFYPYPPTIPIWQVGLALAVIATLLALGWWARTKCPAILIGTLWYLGTLVPVIGIVQVGNQPLADRYTYVPLIGIFVAIAWAGQTWLTQPGARRIGGALAAIAVLACGALTWVQVGRWQDSETLFTHTLDVTEGNFLAHNNLGQVYFTEQRYPEAVAQFEAALPFTPKDHLGSAYHNLGSMLELTNDLDRAENYLEKAFDFPLRSKSATLMTLGKVLAKQNRHEDAIERYRQAIKLDRDNTAAHHRLAQSLSTLGRHEEAIREVQRAVELEPKNIDLRIDAAKILIAARRIDDAVKSLRQSDQAIPNNPTLLNELGSTLMQASKPADAVPVFRRAVEAGPNQAGIRCNLGKALIMSGDVAAGVAELDKTLQAKNPAVRKFAIQTLQGAARQHAVAVEALRRAANSGDAQLAQLAKQALRAIGR